MQRFLFFWFLIAVGYSSLIAQPILEVEDVIFTGNKAYNKRELLSLMEQRPKWPFNNIEFSERALDSDINVLKEFYRNQGYRSMNAVIEKVERDTSKKQVSIEISIQEGPRTIVSSVSIESKRIPDANLYFKRLQTKPGEPLIMNRVTQDVSLIKDSLGNRGFLKAEANPDITIDSAKHIANIAFRLDEGPLFTAGDIRVKGLVDLQSKVVTRELVFKKGDLLTLDKIRRSERQLYRTGLLSFARIEPTLDSNSHARRLPDSTYPVLVTVNQSDFLKLQTGLGYGTDEGFRASLETSYANLWSWGHRIGLSGKASQRLQEGEISYSTPWIFNVPLEFNASIYFTRYSDPDIFEGLVNGLRLEAGRRMDQYLLYNFWTRWENVRWIELPEGDSVPQVNVPENNTQSIGASLIYDKRNSLIDPTDGVYSQVEGEIAGLTGANSNQFYKFSFDGRFYKKFRSKLSIASAIRAGYEDVYGGFTDIVPLQERFYTGGSRSVRGFEKDRLDTLPISATNISGGQVLLALNIVEVRYPIFWLISGAVFADAGYVWENFNDFRSNLGDFRWTAGAGLRLSTPIAVLRVDYAHKLDKKPNEPPGKWHFELGQAF